MCVFKSNLERTIESSHMSYGGYELTREQIEPFFQQCQEIQQAIKDRLKAEKDKREVEKTEAFKEAKETGKPPCIW